MSLAVAAPAQVVQEAAASPAQLEIGARLDGLRVALAQPIALDETVHLLEQAEVLHAAARAARVGLEVTNDAAEVKLRAERQCGALLARARAESPTRYGRSDRKGQPRHAVPHGVLAELGITGNESSRWQLIAALPEPEFELRVRAVRSAGRELSSTMFVRAAQQFTRQSGGGRKTTPTTTLLRRVLRLMRDVTALRTSTEADLARQVLSTARGWRLPATTAGSAPSGTAGIARDVTCMLCGRTRPATLPTRCQTCGGAWLSL